MGASPTSVLVPLTQLHQGFKMVSSSQIKQRRLDYLEASTLYCSTATLPTAALRCAVPLPQLTPDIQSVLLAPANLQLSPSCTPLDASMGFQFRIPSLLLLQRRPDEEQQGQQPYARRVNALRAAS
jgi:hypothetical protein